MVSSANAFLPSVCPPEGKSATGTRDAGAGSGVDDVVQQATATAAAAGGWMASTFSCKIVCALVGRCLTNFIALYYTTA